MSLMLGSCQDPTTQTCGLMRTRKIFSGMIIKDLRAVSILNCHVFPLKAVRVIQGPNVLPQDLGIMRSSRFVERGASTRGSAEWCPGVHRGVYQWAQMVSIHIIRYNSLKSVNSRKRKGIRLLSCICRIPSKLIMSRPLCQLSYGPPMLLAAIVRSIV
jgi:hypothetical protein